MLLLKLDKNKELHFQIIKKIFMITSKGTNTKIIINIQQLLEQRIKTIQLTIRMSLKKELFQDEEKTLNTQLIQSIDKQQCINDNIHKDHNILFTLLNKFIREIRKLDNDKLLQNEDIQGYITKCTSVDDQIERLKAFKDQNKQHFLPENFNLFKLYFHMTGKNLLKGMAFLVIASLLNLFGIFLLDLVTDQLKILNGETNKKTEICLLIIGMLITFVITNICHCQYEWQDHKWQAKCKTSLQYLVYEKALKMQDYTQNHQNDYDDNNLDYQKEEVTSFEKQNPDINNILTVDVDETMKLYWGLIETISSILTIFIILMLIYYRIGSAILNGLYVLLGAIIFNFINGYLINEFFGRMYSIKDKRLSLSKDVIQGIKSIKYLGWENIFLEKINKIRRREFKNLVNIKIQDGILSVFWQSLSYILLYSFLVSYVNSGHDLKDSNVFTIIALFGYLIHPVGILPHSLEALVKSRVSYKRIQSFLNQKEIDFAKSIYIFLTLTNICNDFFIFQSTVKESKNQQLNSNQQKQIRNNLAIKITNINTCWPNKETQNDYSNYQPSDMKNHQKIEQDNTQNDNKILDDRNKNQNSKVICLKSEKDDDNFEDVDEEENSNQKSQNDEFILTIEYLQIKKGTLNFVIGPVGSGKTAFLNTLINEMDYVGDNDEESLNQEIKKKQYSIEINGSIGYVAQNHWLQTKTIRDNILFGLEYDDSWYQKCIQVCELQTDLNTFSLKDGKIISSDGNNLSGGQRQRISLCRAIYQNNDIYLFDDIFSSLDVHVAESIFKNAIVKLLISDMKKTVILVTSHYSFLKVKEVSSSIYLLDEGFLNDDKKTINKYLQKHENEIEQQKIVKNQDQVNLTERQKQHENKQTKLENDDIENEFEDIDDEDDNQNEEDIAKIECQSYEDKKQTKLQKNNIVKITKDKINVVNDGLNKIQEDKVEKIELFDELDDGEEQREKGEIKKRTLKKYFLSMGLTYLLCFIISQVLCQVCIIYIDFWLRDQVSSTHSNVFQFLNEYFGSFSQTFLFLTCLCLAFCISAGVFFAICALKASFQLFKQLHNSIMFSKMSFFDKNPTGRIVNRVSDDINEIDDFLPMNFQIAFTTLVSSIGYPIGITIQFPWMIAFQIITVILGYFIMNMYRDVNREMRRLTSVNSGKLLSHIYETCNGLSTVRAFKKENFMIQSYINRLKDNINSFILSQAMQVWMNIRLLLLIDGIQACVCVTTIIFIVFDIGVNYNAIILCLTYSILLGNSFSDFSFYFCETEQNMVSVERVRQYIENDLEKIDIIPKKLQAIKNTAAEEEQYSIIFKNIYMTYETESEEVENIEENNNVQFALKNFSLKIKRGEKIAICGRTGSGKTSILNLLFGMYPFQSGQLYVDQSSLQSYSLRQLRKKMSVIPQFGFLYNASLRDNLDPENEFSEEKLQKIIQNSGINNNFVRDSQQDNDSKFDKDFVIEEGGKNISNGQKQIINFMRIALRETEIICLDEATSNIDPQFDALLHKQLFEFSKDKTLLVITHRLENIEKFDRVIVLDQGQIVECDHYNILKNNKDSFFNKLLKQN